MADSNSASLSRGEPLVAAAATKITATYICNACNGLIAFVNKRPVNPDGSLHWDICKERQFSVIRKHGKPYQTEHETGFIYKGERYPTMKCGPRIVGSSYKLDGCACGIPPWELCMEACEHKL